MFSAGRGRTPTARATRPATISRLANPVRKRVIIVCVRNVAGIPADCAELPCNSACPGSPVSRAVCPFCSGALSMTADTLETLPDLSGDYILSAEQKAEFQRQG